MRIRATLPTLAALALAAGLAATPASAAASGDAVPVVRSWSIERFAAEIRVRRSGVVDVVERIRVRFNGSYNGIFRTIPIQYRTRARLNYTLRLDVEGVEDDAGRPLRTELSRTRHYRKIKIWVPGASDATRTVVIRYRVRNAIRFFEEGDEEWDELYWNVTGDEWPVPIERAEARVQLPAMVTGGVRARAYTGAYGSTEQAADVRVREYVVSAVARKPLGMHEGLTVAVAWDSRIGGADGAYLIRRPSALARLWDAARSNWPLLIPFLVLLLMYWKWSREGRDPTRRPIAPAYEPPEDLTPSEVGVLVDNRPDMRDITAMLVDLAVKGFLIIHETEQEKLLGLVKSRDYDFELKRGRDEWGGLKRHERRVLEGLFDAGVAGERVSVSDLENSFYKELPGIRDAIFDALLARRYYRKRPDRVMRTWVVAGAIVGVAIVAVTQLLSERTGMAPLPGILAGTLSALIMIGFGLVMPARTVSGARALEATLGFEEFLQRVESDRFRRMITGPEMFERYLPYAMAFGVERKWAAAFDDIAREPPAWYHGTSYATFRPTLFAADLSSMSGRAATAMASAPRSSSGSGFGGGGFSGGGFGGGGGGAF